MLFRRSLILVVLFVMFAAFGCGSDSPTDVSPGDLEETVLLPVNTIVAGGRVFDAVTHHEALSNRSQGSVTLTKGEEWVLSFACPQNKLVTSATLRVVHYIQPGLANGAYPRVTVYDGERPVAESNTVIDPEEFFAEWSFELSEPVEDLRFGFEWVNSVTVNQSYAEVELTYAR